MGEENKLDFGKMVLMVSDGDVMKPIGNVVENSVQFESEDFVGMRPLEMRHLAQQGVPVVSMSLTEESGENLSALMKDMDARQAKAMETANRMLDRLKELSFMQREKCTCRRQRRKYQREIKKLSAILTRYCKDNGLKMYRRDEK